MASPRGWKTVWFAQHEVFWTHEFAVDPVKPAETSSASSRSIPRDRSLGCSP